MNDMTTVKYTLRRLSGDWKLLVTILIGFIVATSLIAGAPIYLKSLERQSLETSIERSSNLFLNIFIAAPDTLLSTQNLEDTEKWLADSLQNHVPELQRGRVRHLKTSTHLVGLPDQPIPNVAGHNRWVSRGYFQYLSNLQHYVDFIDGEMASNRILTGPQGPLIEAVIGSETADVFKLQTGNVVTLAPSIGNPTRISVVITGIIEPTDVSEEYWGYSPSIFLDPPPLEDEVAPEVQANPDEPPLALFITQETMAEGIGKAYFGTLVHSSWFIFVDKGTLKEWSISETRSRLKSLQNSLSISMPRSTLITGIDGMLDKLEHRSFFSSIPLLLLGTIMVITVLYYLSMMVSYLVQRREENVALLRSRGANTMQLCRLYALEGLVLTVVAVAIAPFLAMGTVATAGKLPYFREITSGEMLPVEFHLVTFLAATGAGLLGLAIYVIPAAIGSRTGLIIHKLRSSRPPSISFFHRYYLDIGLLVLGGLIFWELHERGQFVSGGLFKEVEINEALLLAPVLFLVVVALIFLRFFPLLVRLISGESATLLHLVIAVTIITLIPSIAIEGLRDGEIFGWILPVASLTALSAAYWITHRSQRFLYYLVGLIFQTGFVASIVAMEPPVSSDLTFVPIISLISIVPLQIVFLILRTLTQSAPVWISMSLWHMSRNPLQYSWLVLLLVMITGLGILTATVGGTLDRSHKERVFYNVGAGIRVTDIQPNSSSNRFDLKERYLKVPGVADVSLAFRGKGIMGATSMGNRFDLLAMESQVFPNISWYRDDFSTLPLTEVMGALQPSNQAEPLMIPKGDTSVGVWVKPKDIYPSVFLWMVVEDSSGFISTVTLGELGEPEWSLMTAEIHPYLKRPLKLVALQLFEPGLGSSGTPGEIMLDNIHVTVGPNDKKQNLDDFEHGLAWNVIPVSSLTGDSLSTTSEDTFDGSRSALFNFGKETNGGVRGFYRSPSGGDLPIVASTPFMTAVGANLGDTLILNVNNRLVSVVVRNTVEYFPTMSPTSSGYILADLELMLDHLNIGNPIFNKMTSNEMFISKSPGTGKAVREAVGQLVRAPHKIHDAEEQLSSYRMDPLITAGWKAIVILSLSIIVFVGGLGYVTYLLSYTYRSRGEMGILRYLGLSRRQMTGLLGLEQLVIILIGLGLGTWAGFQMSTLMVSSVSITETGQQVIPPFILTTNWAFMTLIYLTLTVMFLASLYQLNRGMINQNLHTITRMEG